MDFHLVVSGELAFKLAALILAGLAASMKKRK